MSDDEKVVYLTFEAKDTVTDADTYMACAMCRNKTFTVRYETQKFPTMYCACCGSAIGQIGWACD